MSVFYAFSTIYFIVGLPVLVSDMLTYKYVKAWARIIIFILRLFGVRSSVLNGNAVSTGAAIVCPNHQSYYEIILVFASLRKSVFIMKSSIMNIPIFNLYFKKMGMIPVDRSKFNKNWQALAEEELKKGKQVVIFPEGTRVPIGGKVSYKPGAFRLAKNLNMKIYPVSTNSGEIWKGPGFIKKTGDIYIHFHEAVDPDPDLVREKIESVALK